MTREEATDIETIDEAINNINKIYDDFEKQTCDGCIHKPGTNENYPIECGTCSRFYADKFKKE